MKMYANINEDRMYWYSKHNFPNMLVEVNMDVYHQKSSDGKVMTVDVIDDRPLPPDSDGRINVFKCELAPVSGCMMATKKSHMN